ncbi:TIGR02281 family clan AA aspartic protease [Altererythrobacter indicus]|uniref:TIGR02281 family clan AA aspartic protease n=1 Tax=Altericroceibacterium indicum TaxID=374177 RepID=A0A845A8S2_9SPHN|nr:TIGR02281 family clan AA aspartic protease [Altericroceibacterium indicum]MXP26772.1 TIGR02281 family clan AA aspartic protease [Altericroceibacterium indicum]
MKIAPLWDQLTHSISQLPSSTLLMGALAAMLMGLLGTALLRSVPALGRLLRTLSTFALMAILVLVILQVSRMDPRFEIAVPQIGLPEQVVEGGETRIPLARDGHFWLNAEVNGQPARFLIDTGATITAVSEGTARRAGLTPRRGGLPVQMQTANGMIAAEMTSIDELHFGNVTATGIDALIAPGLGDTNVLGMNFLSRLGSWRVENNVLIIVPKPSKSSEKSV